MALTSPYCRGVAAALIGVAPLARPAHAQAEPHVNCPYCNHKGDKECKRISKKALAIFRRSGALYCSTIASCKSCGGTARLDCDKCSNAAVEARNAAKRKEIADWLRGRREKVDQLIRHEVLHAESPWFRLAFDLKPMMVGRVRYSSFMLTHLYIERFEAHRKRFKEVLQVSDAELPDKCDVYMWRDGADQAISALKFVGMGTSGAGVKLMGADSVYTMHFQKRYMTKDADLHRHMVHNITHLLVSQMTPPNWLGRLKAGWVDAGLAHYFEYLLDRKCTTYCYQEVVRNRNFKGGKWLVPIRKLVGSGEFPSFAEIAQKNTDQLMPLEHALTFSYVHFLLQGDFDESHIEKHGGKGRAVVQLIRDLKAKKPVRHALQNAYGWNPLTFEEKWKEWVLRTYPVR